MVTAQLEKDGWTVRRIWEHELEDDLANVVDEITGMLKN